MKTCLLRKGFHLREISQVRLLVTEHPRFEALHEPQTNILCFRHVPDLLRGDDEALDRHNEALHQRINRSARAYITATVLDGRRVLRITVMNPRTDAQDIAEILLELDGADS